MNNLFITFEGCEGSGKTTIINLLKEDFIKDNINFYLTREPGGSKISEDIRNIILDKANTNMDYMTEALLYAASRRQHLQEIVLPKLNNGYTVICDRYLDSSLVYQGVARNLGIDDVYNINMYATGGKLPDLTIYIDIPVEVGLSRIKTNNRDTNRLDLENINFHKMVRNGYLEIAKRYKDRIKVIDGNRSINEVYNDVKKVIYERINNGF